ncbi:hypothetical protein HOY82DRAFT_611919 [Tuber indicum]|nr:hypothetical protein HOY82DRAFT_611919 [Tuber indicum]
MVEADIRGEKGEVGLVDREGLGGAAADQPTGPSEDGTDLDTATREPEHLVKKVGICVPESRKQGTNSYFNGGNDGKAEGEGEISEDAEPS